MDALKRASAGRITVVIPYYGYARQDRKDRPRVAITSKLVADLLTTAGANRALLVDLHAAQIQGFFNIPVDHLFASPVLVSYFRDMKLPNLTVVSPDAGGVERARFFAKKLEVPLAIVDKRRTDINVTEVMNVIGDVQGRTCLILDDIVDTAGTLVKTVDALLAQGASKVYACASHAVLSGPAVERIAASRMEELIVTNTIPLREEALRVPKIKVLSIAGLLGRAIESIHMETSVTYAVQLRAVVSFSYELLVVSKDETLDLAAKPQRERSKAALEFGAFTHNSPLPTHNCPPCPKG